MTSHDGLRDRLLAGNRSTALDNPKLFSAFVDKTVSLIAALEKLDIEYEVVPNFSRMEDWGRSRAVHDVLELRFRLNDEQHIFTLKEGGALMLEKGGDEEIPARASLVKDMRRKLLALAT